MTEYVKRVNADGEAIECDCCGYWTETAEYEPSIEIRRSQFGLVYLCEICGTSGLDISVMYPSQCKEPRLYRAIGWIANMLRDEIRELKSR